jgi:DNA replication and repair protein RecF
VLVRPNGAGKTNLLGHLLLSPDRPAVRRSGRWRRRARTAPAVAATVGTPDGPADIGTGASGETGRQVPSTAPMPDRRGDEQALRLLWLTPR